LQTSIYRVFAILAIFISAIGLLGLAAFMAEQRTKEIGVRRVLGASISGIILLLSREFLKWVILANLIAWPLAYLFLKDWLNDYPYRISLSIGYFILSGLFALTISWLIVGIQTRKAASANPVDCLRYE
jgi:putative ABC transport system permease protein